MRTMIEYLMIKFKHDEDGLALTEYLLLLGLLVGGVIVAVTLFGTNLGNAWNSWAGFFTRTNVLPR